MSSSDLALSSTASRAPAAASGATAPRYLFNPWIDFLCLGGSSLFVLPLLALLPADGDHEGLGAAMMALSFVINNPHFAHSYQIFYRGFGRKAFGADSDSKLRGRYVFAGIVVPGLLAMFFVACLWHQDARMLGYAVNVMALLVGWHYVKQGYGMLMVDAALKRRYFAASDKTILLANGYAVWLTAWLSGNTSMRELNYWNLPYATFDLPDPLLAIAAVAATATGVMTIGVLARRWQANGGALPVNGVIAYLVTLYGWTLLVQMTPLWLLVIPALHSLQYLVVVYRFQHNYAVARSSAAQDAGVASGASIRGPQARVAWFVAAGIMLGFIGFYVAPFLAQRLFDVDRTIFGPTVFVFIAWIFINVHHYFLDSVMWRRENPETRQFLFS